MRDRSLLLAATLPSLLTAALLACASAPTPTPAPPTSTAGATALPADSAPAPAASASEAAPTTAPEAAFVSVGTIPEPSSLFAIDGAMFIAGMEADYFGREDKQESEAPMFTVGVLHEGKLEFPATMRLEGWWHRVESVVGRWPDSVDMLAITDTGRIGMAEHFVLTSTGWNKKRGECRTRGFDTVCESGTRYTGAQKIGDSLLTLESPLMYGTSKFTTLRGPSIQRKLTPLRSCPPDESMGRKSELVPIAFGALKDGSLVSFGENCKQETMIETWKPEGGEPTLTPLPGATGQIDNWKTRFIHGPSGETFLLTGKIFQAEGGAWKEITLPEKHLNIADVMAATVAPDGALWIAQKSGVFRRNKGEWEKQALPEDVETFSDLATFEGQVWASSGGTLFRQRKAGETGPGAPIRPSHGAATARPRALARPGSARCAQNLVLLYAFTKVTPDDYDFPLTRKALQGHTEYKDSRFVVTRDGGKKFFSAQVSSFDLGKKLVKLIEKEVPNSKPQLICADPEILREVKIDLRTGKTLP